jgi:DNA adenine methylase
MFAEPFLRWAGGKRKLVPQIQALLPKRYGTYHEPFLGGGALFFALQPQRARLNDINAPLMTTYRTVRDDVEGLIKLLRRYSRNEEEFLRVRKFNFGRGSAARKAADFIYVNKCCFNGLYRVNQSGRFNVPFDGTKTDRNVICDAELLRAVSAALQNARFSRAPFDSTTVTARISKGDLVYFDPPYHPLTKTSNFTAFHQNGFDGEDQRRLRDVALELKKRGAFVVISNSNAQLIRELYAHFKIEEVMAARSINSDAEGRGKIKELLIT